MRIFSFICLKLCGKAYFLIGKSVVLILHEGPELQMCCWWDREEKKAPYPVGFQPTTSRSQGVRSTAVLQPLPWKQNFKN